MAGINSKKASFRAGDKVRVNFGDKKLDAVVNEVRGPVGFGGRRLYAVEVFMEPDEPFAMEVGETDLEKRGKEAPMDPRKAFEYLKRGGLELILISNLQAGEKQPAVWLRYDLHGNVTFTFVRDRGLVGGAPIPFDVFHGNRIMQSKVAQVTKFIESFGFTSHEAAQVLKSVGVSRKSA
jgi:hypothetical protein